MDRGGTVKFDSTARTVLSLFMILTFVLTPATSVFGSTAHPTPTTTNQATATQPPASKTTSFSPSVPTFAPASTPSANIQSRPETTPPSIPGYSLLKWDDFNGSSLDSFWTIVDGENGNSVAVASDNLTINDAADNGMWSGSSGAPLVLSASSVNGSFDFRALGSWDGSTDALRGFGIIVYQDSSNWLSTEIDPEGRMDNIQTIGGSSGESPAYVTPPNPCYMRITRTGDTYTFYYSADGDAWTQISSGTYQLSSVKLGMYARSWGVQLTAAFDWAGIFVTAAQMSYGETTVNTGGCDNFNGYGVAYKVSVASAITVTSISAYFRYVYSGAQVNVALYNSDGTQPTTLVVAGTSREVTGSGWMNFAVSPTTIAPGTYFLSEQASTSGAYRCVGGGSYSTYGDYAYAVSFYWQDFPSPWPSPYGFGVYKAAEYLSGPVQEGQTAITLSCFGGPSGSGYVTLDGNNVPCGGAALIDANSTHTIAANSPMDCGTGCQYVFTGWSDSGDQSHEVSPSSATTYTATYTALVSVHLEIDTPTSYNVTGGGMAVDGNLTAIPTTFSWFVGSNHTLSANTRITIGQAVYHFDSWSDSGDQNHTITVQGVQTYTASYVREPSPDFHEVNPALSVNGERNFESAAIDTVNGYAYFGSYSSGDIVKVRLSDFAVVGTLPSGTYGLNAAVMDAAHGYAYFGTDDYPAQVVKVDLSNFTVAGILSFNSGENEIYSAVIDSPAGVAYFGLWYNAQVVKVDLSNFTETGTITDNSLRGFTTAVIDPSGGFAYFGTPSYPGQIMRIDLANFTEAGILTLNSGENELWSSVIDPARGFAYFGASTWPEEVIKINLSTFSEVGTLTFGNGENYAFFGAAIDTRAGFAYFATDTYPSRVVKVRLFDLTEVDSITLRSGENLAEPTVIDPGAGYLYLGTWTNPAQVVRVYIGNSTAPQANYTITFHTDPTATGSVYLNGIGSFTDGQSATGFLAGAYTVVANGPSGYTFGSWSTQNVNVVGSGTATMTVSGDGDVTVHWSPMIMAEVEIASNPAGSNFVTVDNIRITTPANFSWVVGSVHTISADSTVGCGAGCQYIFTSWDDSGAQTHDVTASAPMIISAEFQQQYYLTVSAGSGGSVLPASEWLNSGDTVQVSATPNYGQHFGAWNGTGTGSYSGTDNPANVTVNAAVTEEAIFGEVRVAVGMTSDPAGSGYLVIDNSVITTPDGFDWAVGSTHTLSANSPVACGSGCQYVFTGWSDNGTQSHNVTITDSMNITATFQLQYSMTVSTSPMVDNVSLGQVTQNQTEEGTCGTGCYWYNDTTTISATESEYAPATFSSWTLDGNPAGSTNPISVLMTSSHTLTAAFVPGSADYMDDNFAANLDGWTYYGTCNGVTPSQDASTGYPDGATMGSAKVGGSVSDCDMGIQKPATVSAGGPLWLSFNYRVDVGSSCWGSSGPATVYVAVIDTESGITLYYSTPLSGFSGPGAYTGGTGSTGWQYFGLSPYPPKTTAGFTPVDLTAHGTAGHTSITVRLYVAAGGCATSYTGWFDDVRLTTSTQVQVTSTIPSATVNVAGGAQAPGTYGRFDYWAAGTTQTLTAPPTVSWGSSGSYNFVGWYDVNTATLTSSATLTYTVPATTDAVEAVYGAAPQTDTFTGLGSGSSDLGGWYYTSDWATGGQAWCGGFTTTIDTTQGGASSPSIELTGTPTWPGNWYSGSLYGSCIAGIAKPLDESAWTSGPLYFGMNYRALNSYSETPPTVYVRVYDMVTGGTLYSSTVVANWGNNCSGNPCYEDTAWQYPGTPYGVSTTDLRASLAGHKYVVVYLYLVESTNHVRGSNTDWFDDITLTNSVPITVRTDVPANSTTITLDSQPITTPAVYSWNVGSTQSLTAPGTASCGSGCTYSFYGWYSTSTGIVASSTISYHVPDAAENLTAVYVKPMPNDSFDSGLDGWYYTTQTGCETMAASTDQTTGGLSSPSAKVTGTATYSPGYDRCVAGIEVPVDASSWTSGPIYLNFNYRAALSNPGYYYGSLTASVAVYDLLTGAQLYSAPLIPDGFGGCGGGYGCYYIDSGWQYPGAAPYPPKTTWGYEPVNLASNLGTKRLLLIYFYMNDASFQGTYTAWLDDVHLTASTPVTVTSDIPGSSFLTVDGSQATVPPNSYYWTAGSTHTLTAQQSVSWGSGYYYFVAWYVPSRGVIRGASTLTYTVSSAPENIEAIYAATPPNDNLDSDMNGWSYTNDWPASSLTSHTTTSCGMSASLDSSTGSPTQPSAKVSGVSVNNHGGWWANSGDLTCYSGIEKPVDLSSWLGGPLYLSLNYKVESSSNTANANLAIYDAVTGAQLGSSLVIVSGVQSQGWTSWTSPDLSGSLKGHPYVVMYLYLTSNTNDSTFTDEFDHMSMTLPLGSSVQMQVESATNQGPIIIRTSVGDIEGAVSIAESSLPAQGKPANMTFPYGFIRFQVTHITAGATVTVTITYPGNVPSNAQYWKYSSTTGWTNMTSIMGGSSGGNMITLTLTDGGAGDEDGSANGVIVDDGGVAVPPPPGNGIVIVTSVAPTITSIQIDPGDGSNASAINVDTYYLFKVTVSTPNGTLNNLQKMELRLYQGSTSWTLTLDTERRQGFAWSYTGAWTQLGPSGWTTPDGVYFDSTNSSTPNLSGNSGTFTFRLKVMKVTHYTTGLGWYVQASALDKANHEAMKSNKFDTNLYLHLTVPTSITWTATAGSTNVEASGMPFAISYQSNAIVKLQLNATDPTSQYSDTFGASNLRISDTTNPNGPHSQTLSNSLADWETGLGVTDRGALDAYWFVSVPNGQPTGTYTFTYNMSVAFQDYAT
jgi:hypothetical protein